MIEECTAPPPNAKQNMEKSHDISTRCLPMCSVTMHYDHSIARDVNRVSVLTVSSPDDDAAAEWRLAIAAAHTDQREATGHWTQGAQVRSVKSCEMLRSKKRVCVSRACCRHCFDQIPHDNRFDAAAGRSMSDLMRNFVFIPSMAMMHIDPRCREHM